MLGGNGRCAAGSLKWQPQKKEKFTMKLIVCFVGAVALTWTYIAFAQEQSPSVTTGEKTSTTVETATTPESAKPTSTAAPARVEQGGTENQEPTAARKEQPSPSPSAAPTNGKRSPQAALKDAENRWATAIASHDRAAVESLIDRDFIGVNEKGKVQNRRALLGEMKADKDTYASVRNERLEVHTHGSGVAVVVGAFRAKGTTKDGKAFDRTYRFTDTWVERNGQWQCVASQDMLLSPK